ncbi:MAG: hypothetical protein ACLPJH_13010 [Myxococcaceae bacterium]
MRQSFRRLPLVGLVALGAACGGRYNTKVPDDLVRQLPYENKIDLLEAENDLFIAYDKVDETENEVSRTRDQIRRAKRAEGIASDEVGQARDPASKEIAQLTVEEVRARIEYLRARQTLNVQARDVEEVARQCAIARYQLARLLAVRKAKVKGSEGYKPEDFERQVKSCDAEVADRKKGLKPDEETLSRTRADWEKRKEVLAKRTFDARASPFVERL